MDTRKLSKRNRNALRRDSRAKARLTYISKREREEARARLLRTMPLEPIAENFVVDTDDMGRAS